MQAVSSHHSFLHIGSLLHHRKLHLQEQACCASPVGTASLITSLPLPIILVCVAGHRKSISPVVVVVSGVGGAVSAVVSAVVPGVGCEVSAVVSEVGCVVSVVVSGVGWDVSVEVSGPRVS